MPSVSLTTLLHVARSGMLSQQAHIDVIANNIANINTVGYKRSRAEFHEILDTELEAPPADHNRTSGQAAGTILADNQRLFEQGVIQPSEQDWDMAIEGEGFFPLQLADGSLAYTRDGTFRLDGEGRLINARGYPLSSGITLPPDAQETLISPNGEVMVRRTGETEPQTIGTITLARFINPAGLEKIGENLYQSSNASGQAQVGPPGENGFGQILGHALEDSNVDLSREVVQLINAQRAYSLMVRTVETSDEMFNLANQMR
jgi:flagellar basal-body rod protein FlgG